jgi:membrane-associated phospholipid phosphatase
MKIKIIVLFFVSLFILEGETVSAQNWDINLLKSINVDRNKQLDPFFNTTSNSVLPITIIAPASFMLHGLITKDSLTLRNGLVIGASIAVGIAFTQGLKYSINRTRPYLEYPLLLDPVTTESSPSFPSSHTSIAFSVATSVSLCYPKWYVIAPMYLWAGTVGYSRMHLGVHYPSDVFMGAIVGSACAYLTFKANQWINKKCSKR